MARLTNTAVLMGLAVCARLRGIVSRYADDALNYARACTGTQICILSFRYRQRRSLVFSIFFFSPTIGR